MTAATDPTAKRTPDDRIRPVMDERADKRMLDMTWESVGDSLMLTREGLGKDGATYLGCQPFFINGNVATPKQISK